MFHFTGKFNSFDWTIFWFETGAVLLLPPLFLHFCLEFPLRNNWITASGLCCMPSTFRRALLLLAQVGIHQRRYRAYIPSPIVLRDILDNLGDFNFGFYFVLSAARLVQTYRTVRTPELRQQMKWVTRGTALAVVPYFVFQSIPRLAGFAPETMVDFAIFPLVLIPISFGYAIHRYRLMDVDIIFKRGVTYTLSDGVHHWSVCDRRGACRRFVGAGFEPLSRWPELSQPSSPRCCLLRSRINFRSGSTSSSIVTDIDVRQTLIDFGRTLGSEVHLEKMLDRIVDRLEPCAVGQSRSDFPRASVRSVAVRSTLGQPASRFRRMPISHS